MILTCPACRTRYRVADEALDRPAGRNVRCAQCGHVWREKRGTAEIRAEQRAAIFGTPIPERGLAVPPRPGAPALPEETRRRGTGGLAIGVAVLAVLILLAIIAAFLARSEIAALWPPAARIYALLGLHA